MTGSGSGDQALWDDAPQRYVPGEVRRALDRDLKTARDRGRDFLETEVAAVRRQANDLDRLERMLASDGKAKTWDYNPKTTAHQAYLDAVRRLFGAGDDDDDPFVRAVHELDEAARARAAAELDAEGSEPAD
jgi:hypothetical protein